MVERFHHGWSAIQNRSTKNIRDEVTIGRSFQEIASRNFENCFTIAFNRQEINCRRSSRCGHKVGTKGGEYHSAPAPLKRALLLLRRSFVRRDRYLLGEAQLLTVIDGTVITFLSAVILAASPFAEA